MNYVDLVAEVAAKIEPKNYKVEVEAGEGDCVEVRSKVAQKQVDEILKATRDTILEELLTTPIDTDAEVRFPGIGKFTVRKVKPQTGRKIGDRIVDIPLQHVLDFHPFDGARVK